LNEHGNKCWLEWHKYIWFGKQDEVKPKLEDDNIFRSICHHLTHWLNHNFIMLYRTSLYLISIHVEKECGSFFCYYALWITNGKTCGNSEEANFRSNLFINTAKRRYRKFETNIPRKGIARPQSQFHILVFVSDLYIYPLNRSTYFPPAE